MNKKLNFFFSLFHSFSLISDRKIEMSMSVPSSSRSLFACGGQILPNPR